jgi:tetratricopeptide (TPR) repeat protein
LSQAGDPSGALRIYFKASKLEPGHPMPYLNASRVYQQLNQMQSAKLHMKKALELDDALSLTLVDIAQYKLQQNKKHGIIAPHQFPLSSPEIPQNQEQGANGHDFVSSHSIDHVVEMMSVTEILDCALDQARHVSEILDIFTAKQIAAFYQDLQEKGLVSSIV